MDDDSNDGLPGQDSFIDVVCNMVGILIILVMIVGVRASRAVTAPPDAAAAPHAAAPADEATRRQIEQEASAVAVVEREIEQAARDVVDLAAQGTLADARRQQLTLVKATVEQAIDQRRSQLDDQGRRQFDVQRDIAAAEIKLHELEQQRMAALAEPTEVEQIQCVPTPLARTVTGEEIHVRLKHGLLAVVPVDALLAEIERRGAHYIRNNLKERNQAEDVFGPIDGFRMRLSVERLESADLPGTAPTAVAQRTQLALQGVFLPTGDRLGQAVEQALLPGSPLMAAIRAKRSASPAVVVWVYPDSYSELRTIKRAMWDAGMPLAIRPLTASQPIIFSTAGTRAAAQ
ncbi:MAG: hypothetical protein IT424_06030 [Pirellulales bacterium]|nr:hypothetical protein [Pirellulales bacterium]